MMRFKAGALFGLSMGLAFGALSARAETHALIMTIGAYKGGIPPLLGVRHDIESARTIARSMGVRDANMRFYRDGALTLAGMRKAFAELDARVGQGDQVFVYYSGHGGRQLVRDPEERCAESLVTVDGEGFTDVELAGELRRLGARARKLVVLIDACHSGGVTARNISAPGKAPKTPVFAPKYASRGAADVCEKPVNALLQQLTTQTRSVGSGASNYVYIAAARDNEVSLDMPARGGVATQAWRDCIAGAAIDVDASGGLSAEEIRVCAQGRINTALKNVPGFLPHNVTVTGNGRAVLAFSERTTAAPAAAPAKPAPLSTLPAISTLNDIYHGRDDKRIVALTAARPAFRIGVDDVEFTLTSTHPGHVYLLMVGSDGKTFDMLFPNRIDGANGIEAGQSLRLPRPSWQIKAGGPPGTNHVLAIVSDAPRDFSKVGMQPAGPFSVLAATPVASRDIQLVSGSSASAGVAECAAPPAKRTLIVQQRCSDGYGAALMTLEEVR